MLLRRKHRRAGGMARQASSHLARLLCRRSGHYWRVSAGAFAKRQLQQCRRGGYRGAQSRSWLRHSLRHLALLHGRAVARSCRFFTSNQAMPTRSLTHSFVFLHATKISSNRRGARGLESTPSAGPRPMARAGAGELANQRRPPPPPSRNTNTRSHTTPRGLLPQCRRLGAGG
jgi:hypothetical protein